MIRRAALAGAFCAGLLGLAGAAEAACPRPLDMRVLPAEAQPAPHPWPQWMGFTQTLTSQLSRRNLSTVDLVFLGDSLIYSWTPEIFQQFYGHRRAQNLGIPGDTTQSLLWRLGRGNWPAALRPRVVVLLIGTNNGAFGWPAEPTAGAVMRVVEEVRARAPGVRVVLVGLLPRGAEPSEPARAVNRDVNELLRQCDDGQSIFWVDAGSFLLDGQQRLTPLISHDQTHLTPYGYTILSTVIEPVLRLALERGPPPTR